VPDAKLSRLDQIRAISNADDRVGAAQQYVALHSEAVQEGLEVRDAAAREMIDAYGVTRTARQMGVSVSLVKQIRGRS
jgi:hypothetical protein